MQWFINVGFLPFGIVMTIIFVALLIIPAFKVLERIGINGWFSVLAAIPFVSIIALWVLAFIRWPSDNQPDTGEEQQEESKKVRKSETVQSENE